MVGYAHASHEHAVARRIQGPDGKDDGRKCFKARGCRTRLDVRHNISALTLINKVMIHATLSSNVLFPLPNRDDHQIYGCRC
jgi:hypothetical protein